MRRDASSLAGVTQGLARIEGLLGRLVALEEERRAGERHLEELGGLLAGGDSQAGGDAFADQALVAAHFHLLDGGYGINLPDRSQRPATPEEARRLEQLVGRRSRWRMG